MVVYDENSNHYYNYAKRYENQWSWVTLSIDSANQNIHFYLNGTESDARHGTGTTSPLHYENRLKSYGLDDYYIGTTTFCSILSDDPDYVGSSSIYNKKFKRKEYQHEIIEVPVTTMDNFIEENGLDYKFLDIVKVDIEGYTFELLQGFSKHINNVKMFHLETEHSSTHKNHVNSYEIANYMRSKNFILAGTQHEWENDIEDQIWINKYLINNIKERSKWLKY
jgi:FkbM family methyltransferase